MTRTSSSVLKWITRLVVWGSLILVVGLFYLYFSFLRDLPDLKALKDYRPALTSVVLDREGNLVGEFFEHRRSITPLEDMPEHLIQAFIAAEDGKFYAHSGIDFASIVRAAWANIKARGQRVQGASTITQQMVKQLLLSPKRTYRRKIREIVLAYRIEQSFTKEEILFLYLNEIYFGAGAYGVAEASRTYFAKDVQSLSIAESALIAGLPKAPGKNSPYRNPQVSEARRLYVLKRMRQEGFISKDNYDYAARTRPTLSAPPGKADFDVSAYFVEEVRRDLVQRLGNETVLRGGLRVETTLDLDLQRKAVEAVRSGLEQLDRRQGYRGPNRTSSDENIQITIQTLAESNKLLGENEEILMNFPERSLLEGVITKLDEVDQSAQVAFAPGFTRTVFLEDVSWARPRDLTKSAKTIKNISEVFRVGDIATFLEQGAEIEGLRRLTLVQKPEAQAAIMAIDVSTHEILAMVGGYDFESSEFNRAIQARRQPGSAFKPIIYGAALRHGYTPTSILWDRPVVYEDETTGFTWRPENYGRRFLGPLTMSEALARSVNNATIHLLRDIGVDNVISYARELGIEAPLTSDLSLGLGSSPVSLFELTRAYTIFASLGKQVSPKYIRGVYDRDNELILSDIALKPNLEVQVQGSGGKEIETGETAKDQILEKTEAFLASHLVQGVVTHPRGTGRRAKKLKRPLGGKTGTTNEQGDAWFVGYSPTLVTGVWVGFDSKKGLGKGETGGKAALPIWIQFMEAALAGRPISEFPVPKGIVFARVDATTGELATSAGKNTFFQAFIEGTEPTQKLDKKSVLENRRSLRSDF